VVVEVDALAFAAGAGLLAFEPFTDRALGVESGDAAAAGDVAGGWPGVGGGEALGVEGFGVGA